MNDKCPFCKADVAQHHREDAVTVFQCGTVRERLFDSEIAYARDERCYERQIEQLQIRCRELEDERDRLRKDYVTVVDKFDDCRAALARACEHFGIDPTQLDSEQDWHEWLIRKLDEAVAATEGKPK